MSSRHVRRIALIVLLGFGALHCAGAETCEVNINGLLTPEGRKVKPPADGKPVYYWPLIVGYIERGPGQAGTKPPTEKSVMAPLLKVLAKEGYLPATKESGVPSLLLVIGWGAIHPNILQPVGAEDADEGLVINKQEMLSILGGHTINFFAEDLDTDALMAETKTDRYFVSVLAYDFKAATQREKRLLWRTNMSVHSGGIEFEEIAASMILRGSTLFGRHSDRPTWVTAPMRVAKAELGPFEVLEYMDTPAPAKAAQSEPPAKQTGTASDKQ
jgi:hypothetical protein